MSPGVSSNSVGPTTSACKKVAIIGSGVAGMGAAWLLSRDKSKFQVTIYEADSYFGGHTHTVDVASLKDPSKKVGVDTGFIVCNPMTYPNFLNFLDAIDIPLTQSDMSFSVSRNQGEFEWCGDNINTVFAQRTNLLPIGHGQEGSGIWGMLREVFRFHDQAAKIASEADALQFDEQGLPKNVKESEKVHPYATMTLGEFFDKFRYSRFFYQNYVLPMTAAIWSTPANMTFDQFPVLTLLRFMRNHVMLQIGGRPKWRTVDGGSRQYVKRVLENVPDARLNTPVKSVQPLPSGKVAVVDAKGNREEFDHVIFATHSDQALAMLGQHATAEERKILGSIKFVDNRAVLHRDINLMPKRRLAWASWNYLTEVSNEKQSQTMCLTYWMNRLQPFVTEDDYGTVLVTMNPLREPDPNTVLGEWQYTHPLYNPETIAAQDNLNQIQNKRNITFAGAWTNYGFHEDGLTSGLTAAMSLGAECPFRIVLNGGYPTHRVCPEPPAWAAKIGVKRYECGRPLYASEEERKAALAKLKGMTPQASSSSSSSVFGLGVVLIGLGVLGGVLALLSASSV